MKYIEIDDEYVKSIFEIDQIYRIDLTYPTENSCLLVVFFKDGTKITTQKNAIEIYKKLYNQTIAMSEKIDEIEKKYSKQKCKQ